MDKKIPEEIKPFVSKLKHEFDPEKIILFGSRAKGKEWKKSDYDFIIVSKKFKNMHWLKRISNIVRLWDVIADIDILPYTPEEFEIKKINSSMIRSIIKQGIVIAG